MSKRKGLEFYNHIVFSTDRKKEKPSDCIYLSEDRHCKKYGYFMYGEKCFEASKCELKVKEKDREKEKKTKTKTLSAKSERNRLQYNIRLSECSLPEFAQIECKEGNGSIGGVYMSYNAARGTISVKVYSSKVPNIKSDREYLYPECFENGTLILITDSDMQYLVNDTIKCKEINYKK